MPMSSFPSIRALIHLFNGYPLHICLGAGLLDLFDQITIGAAHNLGVY